MAEKKGKPVYVLRKNTVTQIEQFIKAISRQKGKKVSEELLTNAVKEAERAVQQIGQGKVEIELHPQGSYVRHLQHQIAEQYGLKSASSGREPSRHVVISRL
jgi:N-acetylglucosamine kinase-like BadF-type ATPase